MVAVAEVYGGGVLRLVRGAWWRDGESGTIFDMSSRDM